MAFCSLPCWTYFSALAKTFCLLKPNNAIRASNSRPWSSPKNVGHRTGCQSRETAPEYRPRGSSAISADGRPDKANCTSGQCGCDGYQGLPEGSVPKGF